MGIGHSLSRREVLVPGRPAYGYRHHTGPGKSFIRTPASTVLVQICQRYSPDSARQ